MMRTPSQACYDLIGGSEGEKLVAYQDPNGIWTIGKGHTKGVHAGMQITPQQSADFFKSDVQDAVDTIYANVPASIIDSLPRPCFDALVSFVFNVGSHAFTDPDTGKRTTFWKVLTGPDLSAVATQMLRWTHDARGDVLPGLVKRRGLEAAMWLSGLTTEYERPDDQHPEAARTTAESHTVQPSPPPSKVTQTTTGKLQTGAVIAGGTAAIIQGVQQAQPIINAAQQVTSLTAGFPAWLKLASVVLVGVTIALAGLTLWHKHKSLRQ